MEQLQSMLRQYNLNHIDDLNIAPWTKEYTKDLFPKHWTLVYNIMDHIPRNKHVIEIGCGTADIVAILCYLGFKNIKAYEQNLTIANLANKKIKELFHRSNIITNSFYPDGNQGKPDILIMVNCAYPYKTSNKAEYMELIMKYYKEAYCPYLFLLEVIDDSYTLEDSEFPYHIRLNKNDITSMFPKSNITSYKTYTYPKNKRSKTLYKIENI